MRIGIFSDTHSNLEALTAVLGAFKHESVDKLVCLGDTVGYGASPNECCDLVREAAAFTILGNHDAAVAGRMDYSYYYDAARQALDLHASILSPDNMKWLQGLPYEVREGGPESANGAPRITSSRSATARRSTSRSSSTSSPPSRRRAACPSGTSWRT
jgi:predicted MPP superfamily phosphohydrolase